VHDLSLIATIAAAFTGAWLLGLVTQRLGLSPIVGYLLAGVFIGPHTPGFVGDVQIAQQLAEIGVILLMFGVGLHFRLKDLLAVRAVAIPGAVGQSLIATGCSVAIFTAFGLPVETGLVIGMAMSVASTVVLMRVLMDADVLDSPQGHVAVGWLIVEDIFTVILLVMIPVLADGDPNATAAGAGRPGFWATLAIAVLKLAALVATVLWVGGKLVPRVLVQVARLRSHELFTLTVLVFSIAVAAGSYFFFGASMALGAFLAGMVVGQSPVSHQAAADALPLRDAFAVLFFVSVGMLFDPLFLLQQPWMVASALAIILIAKPLAALLIVAVLGHSIRTALTVAIGLAQIGEFSFILSDLSRQHGLMPEAGHNLLVASAIISITLNPLLFGALPEIEAWLNARPRLAGLLGRRAEKRVLAANAATVDTVTEREGDGVDLAIVVGYGPVGRSVHRLLREAKLATVVIDMNMDTIASLRGEGQPAIFGDAAHESLLAQAGIRRASHLILTLPHSSDRAAVVAAARNLNPDLRILVRARYLSEREDLEQAGATAAVFEEAEAAVALARLVLADTGLYREAADTKIKDLRLQLILENVTKIRSQRVRSVMVPWRRVRWLPASATRDDVLEQVSQERFSRWPVVEPSSKDVVGYLLTRDLIAHAADRDWHGLVRPLGYVHPDDSVESVLARMQEASVSLYLVQDADRPVGLVTMEDILEQVVGQIEDEYPREAPISLLSAMNRGAILQELRSKTGEHAIAELVAAIPGHVLPEGIDTERIVAAVMRRESEISTDLGNGVAVPHARIANLQAPIAVLGRSLDGLLYSAESVDLVHLVFLLLTPAEQPEAQLTLLGQVANVCDDAVARETLLRAVSSAEAMSIIARFRAGKRASG
jgi:monovalent cation:H+ antiporter-2, CPA2 family